MKCPKCKVDVVYEAELAAPGIGYSYVCPECKTSYYSVDRERIHSWKDIDPEDVMMDPSDCI